ncbi:ribosome assembly factor SBDS [Candidatus Bathyarchaeota archaeon]|nr:ribosome assembly factor SBDS [Candidatus Bathyarchaeota archaeon]
MSEKLTLIRLSIAGENFEIVVKSDKALDYKLGKEGNIREILVVDTIFSDAKKGMKASSERLLKIFKTEDVYAIAETIMKRGELQITADQRRRLIEDKRRQIIAFISRNCIDPRTNLPHPPLRIEQALSQIKVSIDPLRDAEAQAKDIIEKLRPILPMKFESLRIAVKIPAEYALKAYGTLKGFGTIKQEEWQKDGSWIGILEMPAGLHASFLEKLGNLTQGTMLTKILR